MVTPTLQIQNGTVWIPATDGAVSVDANGNLVSSNCGTLGLTNGAIMIQASITDDNDTPIAAQPIYFRCDSDQNGDFYSSNASGSTSLTKTPLTYLFSISDNRVEFDPLSASQVIMNSATGAGIGTLYYIPRESGYHTITCESLDAIHTDSTSGMITGTRSTNKS